MEQLEAELASLRARAETLNSRHAAADAEFFDAKSKLQRHHLEADLDVDDKARAKLEAAVATCSLTRDGYADALAEVQTKIALAEQTLAAKRSAVERKAASDKLARDLDAVERGLPEYPAAGHRFADVLEKLHFHFESAEMARFVGNTATQIEVAAGFALADLRGMVKAISDGRTPTPAAKPDAGLRGGEFNPQAADVVDLGSIEEPNGASSLIRCCAQPTSPLSTAARKRARSRLRCSRRESSTSGLDAQPDHPPRRRLGYRS